MKEYYRIPIRGISLRYDVEDDYLVLQDRRDHPHTDEIILSEKQAEKLAEAILKLLAKEKKK